MNRQLSVLANAIALTTITLTTLACTATPPGSSDSGQLSSSEPAQTDIDENQAASSSDSSSSGANGAADIDAASPSELIKTIGDRCDQSLEVDYRSLTLVSPDGTTRVQAQGTLRKSADPEYTADSDNFNCLDRYLQTLNRQIAIDKPEGEERIVKDDYDQGYVIFQPRSFSADSSYLVAEVAVGYSGGDAATYTSIIDVAASEELNIAPCESKDIDDIPHQTFLGFTADSKAVFDCSYNAGPEFIEAVNLDTGEMRQLSERPDDLAEYGTVEAEFEVDLARSFE
ncbi:MAG: hypothetical protein WA947_17375 [Phormidesmis sp.]